MKILSIDTSTATCTVGLVNDDDVVAESVDRSGRTHARHIMGMVADTLRRADTLPADVDGFGVVVGPGTFTGLRIGISTIQGLAYALSKPVAGVISLDALAVQAPTEVPRICPMIDARRHQVYAGLYALGAHGLRLRGAHQVASPSALLAQIQGRCLFLGTGARMYRRLIVDTLGVLAAFPEDDGHDIRSDVIAKMARKRFRNTGHHPLPGVSPYYIRRSDAEIKNRQNRT